jgi:hypothetical protein
MIDATIALRKIILFYVIPESHSRTSSVVDPHHRDADLDADPHPTYYPDEDPDSDFNLMRIQIFV